MSFWWLMRMIQRPRFNLCLPKTWSSPCLPRPFCISFTKGLGEARGLFFCGPTGKPTTCLFFSFCPADQHCWRTTLGSFGVRSMSQPSEGQRAVSHAGSWQPPPFTHALQREHHWFQSSVRAHGPSLRVST